MIDNTRVNEIQNKILSAIDILNVQALSTIAFDKTILCTIEDDTNKKEGKYIVNDGSRSFTAYSTETGYRNQEQVYVTIPQGNFENQKMIVGKKVDKENTPFVVTTPFDTIFDMTDNIVEGQALEGQLIANTLNKYGNDSYEYMTLYDAPCDYCNYTKMGIKANFKSWIKQAVRGDYGLYIVLTVSNPNIVGSEAKSQVYDYKFSNSDMLGNSYNFETEYEQQRVISLDKIQGSITNIKIVFYQEANFVDKYNNQIACSQQGYVLDSNTNLPIKDENDDYVISENDTILEPNLFVKDLYLCFGYDISVFTEDLVEIYTQQSNTYKHSNKADNDGIEQNKKIIKMRWVHIDDNDKPIDMTKDMNKNDEYEIRWYRYRIGAAAADAYSNVYWTRIKKEGGKYISGFEYEFNPDIELQQERIKAIIVYNNTPYHSNELLFENEEDLPPSAEAQHIISALTINVDDGTNGNYRIYGQDNSIKDTDYSKTTRSLSVWFDANSSGNLEENERINSDQASNLTWTFPAENTMLQLVDTERVEIYQGDGERRKLVAYQVHTSQPWYKISTRYTPNYSNNTITCQYELNGRIYTTEKEFTFGPAGTMGTNQTLVIDFITDINAINMSADADENIMLKLQLYDNQNIEQNIPLGEVEWAWYYNSNLAQEKTKDGKPMYQFPYVIEDYKNNQILFNKNDFKIGGLYIVQATLGTLTTYFPIPLQSGSYSFIKGPTQVIYQSNGEPAYSHEAYTIYEKNEPVTEGIKWKIISYDENKANLKYIGQISEYTNQLQPLSIYVKDAPIYGVQAYINFTNEKGELEERILWTQPILVLQNQWPNGVINQWDGKSLVLDEETNTILTASIAAGKKNSEDNTFSGVMIGDWGNKDVEGSISKQTGVYGFHHGAMSYAFKEDGTAFLGKDGAGRIYFDGNNATIYSPFFDRNSDPYGMKINLNNASINMKYNGNNIKLDAHEQGVVEGFTSMSQAPFTIGNNFAVAWDGTLYATGGNFKGIISASTLKSSKDMWNPESTSGGIILDGYFSIPTEYKDKNNNTIKGPNGYLGFVESDISGGDGIEYPGIGLSITNDSDITSVIKTTTGHVGMSSGDGYLSATNSSVDMGLSTTRKITIANDMIALYYKMNTAPQGQNNGQYLAIEEDKDGKVKLACWGILPENQSGIYARFA